MITVMTNSTLSDNLLRLGTFADFPRSCPVYSSRLSSAGFNFTGKGDVVVCPACGLEVGNWNVTELPLLVHKQKSPFCPLVNSIVGKDGNMESTKGYQGNMESSKGYQCNEDLCKFEEASKSDQCTEFVYQVKQSEQKELSNYKFDTGDQLDGNYGNNATDNHLKDSHGNSNSEDQLDGLDSGSFVSGVANGSQGVAPSLGYMHSPSLIPYKTPRYPNMVTQFERLKTFKTWSRDRQQSPEDLSKAGFFYTGTNDLVRCFHCGGGLTSWEAEDNPWVEHAHWFPQCCFLRQNKGEEFIQIVQSMVEQLKQETQKQQTSSDALLPTNTNNTRGASGNKLEELVAVKSCQEMGYQMEQIEPAYKEAVKQHKTDNIGAVQLMEKLLEIEERRNNEETVMGACCGGTDQSTDTLTREETTRQSSEERYIGTESNTPESISCLQYETATGECKGAMNGPTYNKDLLLCKVCMEEQVSIVLLPCGHLSTCGQCAPAMTKCPICRQSVKGSVKTYLS